MALVSMKQMLLGALEGGYAVGQFNLNNLEFTQAILQAAQEERAPVILASARRTSLTWGASPALWGWSSR